MENKEKIVNFEKYCRTCKHSKKREYEDPCDDCLDYPVNDEGRRPVRWEAK